MLLFPEVQHIFVGLLNYYFYFREPSWQLKQKFLWLTNGFTVLHLYIQYISINLNKVNINKR